MKSPSYSTQFEPAPPDQPNFRETAGHDNQAINHQIIQKCRHENPIDWYDHPADTTMFGRRATSEHTAQYDENMPDTNKMVKEGQQSIVAYAFSSNDIETPNRLMEDTKTYRQFENKTLEPDG